MAKRVAKQPGIKSLRAFYGPQSFSNNERLLKTSTDLKRLEKLQADAARRYSSEYAALTRQFRKDIAVLKKRGIVRKSTDVRKVKGSSKHFRNLIKDFSDVITGKQQTVKIDKKTKAALKEKGFEVRNGRVVISKEETIIRGEVVNKKFKNQKYTIIRPDEIEEKSEQIFEAMGDDEYVMIDLGDNISQAFNSDELDAFIAYITDYVTRDGEKNNFGQWVNSPLTYIRTVKFSNIDTMKVYMHGKMRERLETRKKKKKIRRDFKKFVKAKYETDDIKKYGKSLRSFRK